MKIITVRIHKEDFTHEDVTVEDRDVESSHPILIRRLEIESAGIGGMPRLTKGELQRMRVMALDAIAKAESLDGDDLVQYSSSDAAVTAMDAMDTLTMVRIYLSLNHAGFRPITLAEVRDSCNLASVEEDEPDPTTPPEAEATETTGAQPLPEVEPVDPLNSGHPTMPTSTNIYSPTFH